MAHKCVLDTDLIRVLNEVTEADEASHRCVLDTDLIRVLNEVTEADEASPRYPLNKCPL